MVVNGNALAAALVEAIVLELVCPSLPVRDARGEVTKHRRFLENGRPGFISGHDFMSAFERAYQALLPTDVFTALNRDGSLLPAGTFSHMYRLEVDVADVYDHILQSADLVKLNEAELFEAFVGLSVAQRCTLPDTRNWFSPDPDLRRVVDQLAAHNYLGRLGERYRWTDKATHAMRSRNLWDEDGNSFEDNEDRKLEKIWHSMPADIRSRYFFDGFDPLGFAICYSHRWDDEREIWIAEDVSQEQGVTVLSGGGVGIAKRLEARYLKPFRAG